jgi:hypothetical protein
MRTGKLHNVEVNIPYSSQIPLGLINEGRCDGRDMYHTGGR